METSVGTVREAIGKSQVRGIHVYGGALTHGITRTNLFLNDEGNCHLRRKSGSFVRADWDTELGRLEASWTTLGWTLNTPYKEHSLSRSIPSPKSRAAPSPRVLLALNCRVPDL